ncbi:MAG: hypothetical protein LBS99_01115 [Clostridiales bacterium]|jgi:hypothetical protein|nr:hypothetical protein [Clostridiales bacterium]
MDKFFSDLLDGITKAVDVTIAYMLIISLGLILAIFLIGGLIGLLSSYSLRYKSAAKKATVYLGKSENLVGVEEYMVKLPKAARLAWSNYYKKRVGKPSENMTVEACLDVPLRRSAIVIVGRILLIAAPVSAAYIAFWYAVNDTLWSAGFFASLLILVVLVCVLYLILYVIRKANYSAILKKHVAFTTALDDEIVESAVPVVESPAEVAIAEPVFVAETSSVLYDFVPAAVNEAEVQATAEAKSSEAVRHETEDAAEYRRSLDEQIAAQRLANEQLIRNTRIADAHAQAARAQAVAAAQAAASAQAAAAAHNEVELNEFLLRVDKIIRECAPLKTMKEAAIKIQMERSRPEYRSIETQRKLNEALSRLLKAMQAHINV